MILGALQHGLLRYELSSLQSDDRAAAGFLHFHAMTTFLAGSRLGLKLDDRGRPIIGGMFDLGVRPACALGKHPKQLDKL